MSKVLKYITQNGGVTFGFAHPHPEEKQDKDNLFGQSDQVDHPTTQSLSTSCHPLMITDVMKVDPSYKNELKKTPIGDYYMAWKSFESFDEHRYSTEADLNLLRMIEDRQRDYVASQLPTSLSIHRQDTIDEKLQNKINAYKQNLRENEKFKQDLEDKTTVSFSQESVLDDVLKLLRRILNRVMNYINMRRENIRKYFNKILNDFEEGKSIYQDKKAFEAHVKAYGEEISNRIKARDITTAIGVLREVGIDHVMALIYLLGDDYRNVKQLITHPDKLINATQKLLTRFEKQLALRTSLNQVLKATNLLAKSLVSVDPSKVTERHLEHHVKLIKSVYQEIEQCLEHHGHKLSQTEYRFAGFKCEDQFTIEIRQKQQYAFPTFSRNTEKEQEIDNTINQLMDSMNADIMKDFVVACMSNPVRLEEGYKSLNRMMNYIGKFRDVDDVTIQYVSELVALKDKLNDVLEADKFVITQDLLIELPEVAKFDTSPALSVPLKTLFQVGVETIVFVTTMIGNQNTDAINAVRAISALMKFYSFSKK